MAGDGGGGRGGGGEEEHRGSFLIEPGKYISLRLTTTLSPVVGFRCCFLAGCDKRAIPHSYVN